MKKAFLTLLVSIFIISCKKEAPVDYAIISGKITNTKNLFLVDGVKVTDTIKLNADGSFIDTLKIKKNVLLYDGKNLTALRLSPKNKVEITYDANDYDNSLSFSGEGFEASKYFSEKRKTTKDIVGANNSYFSLEEEAYKTKMQEVKTALEKLLENYEGLSASFKKTEEKGIYYDYLEKLSIYENYHAYFTKKKDFKVSEDFLEELKDLDYDNEKDFKNYPSYKRLVTSKVRQKAHEIANKDSIDNSLAFLKATKQIKPQGIKNGLAYDAAKYEMAYTKDLDGFFKEFKEISTNQENIEEVTEIYHKFKKLTAGNPSPEFTNYENFNGGTSSLKDFKGKYVYIDVWATWCGPCIGEIPSLKKIEKKYHNKNIAFVSISIDKQKDKDKWKKMVADKELVGTQLFADKDWKSKFVEDYQIKGIPRFILLDKEGKIIDANAPRPSSKKIEEIFNNLK